MKIYCLYPKNQPDYFKNTKKQFFLYIKSLCKFQKISFLVNIFIQFKKE